MGDAANNDLRKPIPHPAPPLTAEDQANIQEDKARKVKREAEKEFSAALDALYAHKFQYQKFVQRFIVSRDDKTDIYYLLDTLKKEKLDSAAIQGGSRYYISTAKLDTSGVDKLEEQATLKNWTYNVEEDKRLIKQINDKKRQDALKKANSEANRIEQADARANATINNSSVLNIDKLIADKIPFFRKSYSAFDSLTPYIKCYITTPELKLLENKQTITSIQKNYFEIPYNMIKSLEVEFSASPGVASTFVLKLEDPTGVVGNIMVAQLYSLGILKNKDGLPKISIEFGWADKGLKKILKGKDFLRFFHKNFFTEYMIQHSDIEFTEKFKQELTLKGNQDQVGIDSLSYLNGNVFSPYVMIGRSPVENIRVLQYYHYFKENESRGFGLNIFKNKDSESPLIKQFIKNGNPISKNKIEANENFLIATCKNENNFFNHVNPQDESSSLIKETFKPFINRTSFHPYIIFCYVLNKYISTMKTFYEKKITQKKQQKIPSIYYLCYYDENNIDGFTKPPGNFDDYCVQDVNSGISKNKNADKNIDNEFLIQENENWGGLLQRLANKVKIKSKEKKEESKPNLYFEINRFIPISSASENSLYNTEFSEVSLNTSAVDILINKFQKIIDHYKEQKKGESKIVKQLREEVQKLIDRKTKEETFIYIIITSGSPFLTEENYPEKPVLQSYTVFPYMQQDNRLEYQNFNSGSKSLFDESYPDVISFRPKINLNDIINANFKTQHHINFNNGVVNFTNKNFDIYKTKNEEDKKTLSKDIKSIVEQLSSDSSKDKKLIIIYNFENYYSINQSNVLFFDKAINDRLQKRTTTFEIGKTQKDTVVLELISGLRERFDAYLNFLMTGYHFSVLNSLLRKSKRIFPGDNNTSSFYSYVNSANEYNKLLNIGAKGFEAELKILGEPAFTYDFGPLSYVLIKVNNFDGSPNYLLSGIYSLKKIKHSIENGKFETTITLMYDSAWGTS